MDKASIAITIVVSLVLIAFTAIAIGGALVWIDFIRIAGGGM